MAPSCLGDVLPSLWAPFSHRPSDLLSPARLTSSPSQFLVSWRFSLPGLSLCLALSVSWVVLFLNVRTPPAFLRPLLMLCWLSWFPLYFALLAPHARLTPSTVLGPLAAHTHAHTHTHTHTHTLGAALPVESSPRGGLPQPFWVAVSTPPPCSAASGPVWSQAREHTATQRALCVTHHRSQSRGRGAAQGPGTGGLSGRQAGSSLRRHCPWPAHEGHPAAVSRLVYPQDTSPGPQASPGTKSPSGEEKQTLAAAEASEVRTPGF